MFVCACLLVPFSFVCDMALQWCYAIHFNRTPRELKLLGEAIQTSHGLHIPPPGYGLTKGKILAGESYFDILLRLKTTGMEATHTNFKVPQCLRCDNLKWQIWIVDGELLDLVMTGARQIQSKENVSPSIISGPVAI